MRDRRADKILAGCHAAGTIAPGAPRTAEVVNVDRFSDAFAHQFRRSADNTLPPPGAAIDFDGPRFRLEGFAPNGQVATWYRLDETSRWPGWVYLIYRRGQDFPVASQLPIVDDVPGDAGYSDLRRTIRVIVPPGYQANLFTSIDDIRRSGTAVDK